MLQALLRRAPALRRATAHLSATAKPDASIHRSSYTKHLRGLSEGAVAPPANAAGSRPPRSPRARAAPRVRAVLERLPRAHDVVQALELGLRVGERLWSGV